MPLFLEKLRSKSSEEKKKIIIWTSAVIVVIIAGLWTIYLINFFNEDNVNQVGGQDSFWGRIKDGFNEVIKSTKK
mgnify:CR=1 FL=1